MFMLNRLYDIGQDDYYTDIIDASNSSCNNKAMATLNRIISCSSVTSDHQSSKTSDLFKTNTDPSQEYKQVMSLIGDHSRSCSHQVQESRRYLCEPGLHYRRDAVETSSEMSCPARHRLTCNNTAECISYLPEDDISDCSNRNKKSVNTRVSSDCSGFKYVVSKPNTCKCKCVRKNAMEDHACVGQEDCCGRTIVNKRVKSAEEPCTSLPRHCVVKDSRRDLSMLTVLLALLAIARSKCLLLSTPLARSSLTAVALACVVFVCILTPAAAQLSPRNKDIATSTNDGVCKSIDVRNFMSGFDALKGCRVVEGSVQILLINHATENNYTNISFPELREITGYLLLYRAFGLRSIGQIFPNLAVIRGNTLMFNYAFVSFEMQDLQEIGLHSLTDIVRGKVLIEKNPQLCYADTINWDLIAKAGGKGDNDIKGNRMRNECPMCPAPTDKTTCPVSSQEHNKGEPLCWNRQHCQKICPPECSSCDENGDCCDKNCLGGCKPGPRSPDNCYACRDYTYKGKCVKQCPSGTFKYLNRRCVLEKECYKMPVPSSEANIEANTTWKTFNGTECILRCPPNYEEKLDSMKFLKCIVCNGLCRKVCGANNVNSIAAAQSLKGCTYISGSLEIQITGGKNIMKELEDNLNMIEEIDGYLKIVRSFPIISLSFLKNLRVIHGNTLETKKYALYVLENQNLQELWEWSARPEGLKIKNGSMFFHFNPKLCLDKIKQLNQKANLPPFAETDVSSHSNGDQTPCNKSTLNAYVGRTTSVAAVINWDKFNITDERKLLGYVVYHIEAPHDLSVYDRRDACGNDGWVVDDVEPKDLKSFLSYLKPYTRYAFYVKTYMISTEKNGAQSELQYFMTDPDVPTVPQMLKVSANSSTELVIKWQPPLHPNGNVTHYIVTATRERDDHSFLGERDYCQEPITPHDKKSILYLPIEQEEKTTPNSCSCEKVNKPSLREKNELEEKQAIDFENTLHNTIYTKKPNFHHDPSSKRRKRSKTFSHLDYDSFRQFASISEYPVALSNKTDDDTFTQVVYNATILVINQLRHYGRYTINVRACRELMAGEKPDRTDISCSTTSFDSARTLHLVGADNVFQLNIEMKNDSLGSVKLMWDEPSQPNGLIVTYEIEYSRMDIENFKPIVECITRQYYRDHDKSHTLTNLLPGNYSVHVRATSLYGNGEYTPKLYFLIKDGSAASGIEWVIAFASLFFIVIFAVIAYVIRRKTAPGVNNMTLFTTVNPEYMSTVYVPDEWEVPRKKIELLRELGQGSFGMVYEGIGRDIADHEPLIRCAIKTVGENATDRERSEFLNEASVMKAFHTHHVVQLLGVVSEGQPVLVVMELMTHGDLKTYLRSHRPDTGGDQSIQPPTLRRILQMAIEIADGMAYLAAKKFVHRDLAARNCMVGDDLTVKIGDFGMTRDIYESDYYRKGTKGLLPVRWMAPESLKDGVFTNRSDVWSYGVVLWEMATLASQPYQGLTNDQVLRYVIDGGVMERPENCPDRLYELMRLCWQHKHVARPPFLDLVSILLSDVGPEFSQVSFYHSKEGCEVRAHLAEVPSLVEDDPTTPLRVTRDIEDFSLGGSDDEDPFEVSAHSPSTSYPRFGSIVATQPPLLHGNDQVVVSLSSNGNKLGNGSAVTSPTAANGWIANHQNGTDLTNASNASLKTTEC